MEEDDSNISAMAESGTETMLKGVITRFDAFYDRYAIEYTDTRSVKGSIWRKHDIAALPDKHGVCIEKIGESWCICKVLVRCKEGGRGGGGGGIETQ